MTALQEQVRGVVDSYCKPPAFRAEITRMLESRGFALHTEAPCRAGTLTLLAFNATCGQQTDTSIQGAAGVELILESSFVFDHIADGQWSLHPGVSCAELLPMGLALLNLGYIAVCEAACSPTTRSPGPAVLKNCLGNVLDACQGQLLDASGARVKCVTLGESLSWTCMKAGGLGRLAAEFGARLATTDPSLIEEFGDLGANLFTYAQLIDDAIDACPRDFLQGDFAQGRKSLPVVFFYNTLDETSSVASVQERERETTLIATGDAERIRREFEGSGGSLFCTIVAEVYLNRAKANLSVLTSRGAKVRELEIYLDSLAGLVHGFLI